MSQLASPVAAASADMASSHTAAFSQASQRALPSRVRVLSIAGTDPTGGAGLMADLRTFAALGAYGMGVVTNVVAQHTRAVQGVWRVPEESLRAQLYAVSDDVAIDGVKIGMMGAASSIAQVASWLREVRERYAAIPVVLDPVMMATSGARLLEESAVGALVDLLRSGLIDVVTPNIPELAELLRICQSAASVQAGALGASQTGDVTSATSSVATASASVLSSEPALAPARDDAALRSQAERLSALLGCRVYAKAGHLPHAQHFGDVFAQPQSCSEYEHEHKREHERDFVHEQQNVAQHEQQSVVEHKPSMSTHVLTAPAVATHNTHGTGCTLSSALTVFQAQHLLQLARSGAAEPQRGSVDWLPAARKAKAFMTGALQHADALLVGQGNGPVDQLWASSFDVSAVTQPQQSPISQQASL